MDIGKRKEYQNKVVKKIISELFGPSEGEEEIILGKPYWRYLSGILFPQELDPESLEESDEPDSEERRDSNGLEDKSLEKAYDNLPSSMGISFLITGQGKMFVTVQAARYESIHDISNEGDDSEKWKRVKISNIEDEPKIEIPIPDLGKNDISQLSITEDGKERAFLVANFRSVNEGHLVTLSLVNAVKARSMVLDEMIRDMLFQSKFSVEIVGSSIGEYPKSEKYISHEEDLEIDLIYKKRKTFGVGHGCSPIWREENEGFINKIIADPLPVTEVKGLSNKLDLSLMRKKHYPFNGLQVPKLMIWRLKSLLTHFWIPMMNGLESRECF